LQLTASGLLPIERGAREMGSKMSRYVRELAAQRELAGSPASHASPLNIPVDLTPGGGLQDRIARQRQAQEDTAYAVTAWYPGTAAYAYPAEHGTTAGRDAYTTEYPGTGAYAYPAEQATTAARDAYTAGRDQYIVQAAPPAADDPAPHSRRPRKITVVIWEYDD
jgi:hypothetical protein